MGNIRFIANLGMKAVIWALVSTIALVTFAGAHEMRPAIADATVTANRVTMVVEVTLETLIAGVDAGTYQDTNDAPQAEEYDRLRALDSDALARELEENWANVRDYFLLNDGELKTGWVLEGAEIPEIGDVELPRDSKITLSMDVAATDGVAIGGRSTLGSFILRHADAGEDAFEGLLSPGELSPALSPMGGAAESAFATFVRYVISGVEHIIPKGLDHILFVLGLFFFSIKMRPLLWQVTAFTLAHTVTLAAASLGLVVVSPAIVEPLIAASIVYVAFENLRSDGNLGRMRMAVVFVFGLLHGLGFASVLGEVGLGQGRFLVSLIGFNIGVEVGQLLVIAGAFIAVGWMGRKAFYKPWIANPASILIGLIGAWWVIERVFL